MAEKNETKVGDFCYSFDNEIGNGSYAIVFKGRRIEDGLPVAIKRVSFHRLRKKLVESLQREIEILKDMRHRNIVQLYATVKTKDHMFLIMELCGEGDLSSYIGKHSPLPEAQIKIFAQQIAAAMLHLYNHDIIHRDLKPQNILLTMVDGQLTAKLADFGFARYLDPMGDLAATLCGSPIYMAPEILEHREYGRKADLWSLGTVLYECSTGHPPFKAPSYQELSKVIRATAPTLQYPEAYSESFLDLLRRLLVPDAERRMCDQEFFQHPFLGMMASVNDQSTSMAHTFLSSYSQDLSTDSELLGRLDTGVYSRPVYTPKMTAGESSNQPPMPLSITSPRPIPGTGREMQTAQSHDKSLQGSSGTPHGISLTGMMHGAVARTTSHTSDTVMGSDEQSPLSLRGQYSTSRGSPTRLQLLQYLNENPLGSAETCRRMSGTSETSQGGDTAWHSRGPVGPPSAKDQLRAASGTKPMPVPQRRRSSLGPGSFSPGSNKLSYPTPPITIPPVVPSYLGQSGSTHSPSPPLSLQFEGGSFLASSGSSTRHGSGSHSGGLQFSRQFIAKFSGDKYAPVMDTGIDDSGADSYVFVDKDNTEVNAFADEVWLSRASSGRRGSAPTGPAAPIAYLAGAAWRAASRCTPARLLSSATQPNFSTHMDQSSSAVYFDDRLYYQMHDLQLQGEAIARLANSYVESVGTGQRREGTALALAVGLYVKALATLKRAMSVAMQLIPQGCLVSPDLEGMIQKVRDNYNDVLKRAAKTEDALLASGGLQNLHQPSVEKAMFSAARKYNQAGAGNETLGNYDTAHLNYRAALLLLCALRSPQTPPADLATLDHYVGFVRQRLERMSSFLQRELCAE